MYNWATKELGDILTLNYGWSLPEKKRVPGNVPVYGSNGIVGSHNNPLVDSPGLIVGRKGSAGNVHFSKKPFCPIDTTFFVAPTDTELDIEFLYYLILHIDLKRILGDVGVPGLNREMAYKEKVRFPERKGEQRKIAAVLRTVQRAIEEQERLLQLTKELKKSLLHKLFTEGLRGEPQKMTEIGLVPESWEVMGFEDFVLLQRGFDLPKSAFKDGSVPVIGATTIIGFHNVWNVRGPGVTVVRSGSSAGKPLYIEKDFWAHNVVLFVKDFHGNNPKFVYYKIQSLDLTKYREGVAVPTLNRNSFKTIPVAIPEKSEQDEFVEILDPLEQKEKQVFKRKAILADLFHTLLHQLMTAQIRVNKLDIKTLMEYSNKNGYNNDMETNNDSLH
jgi:type I restriction enzyme S subunit